MTTVCSSMRVHRKLIRDQVCASCTFRFVLVQIKVHALATSGTQPEEYMVEEADDLSKAAYLNQALREHGQNFSGEKEGVLDQDLQEAVCCKHSMCYFSFVRGLRAGSGLDGRAH